MKLERCKKKVYPNNSWGSFHPHQCQKTVWKDGYCKIHHPDSVAMRQEKQNKRWEEKMENNPLKKAMERLDLLEDINKDLLEACKWALEAQGWTSDDPNETRWTTLYSRLKMAVAKAEGKEP